ILTEKIPACCPRLATIMPTSPRGTIPTPTTIDKTTFLCWMPSSSKRFQVDVAAKLFLGDAATSDLEHLAEVEPLEPGRIIIAGIHCNCPAVSAFPVTGRRIRRLYPQLSGGCCAGSLNDKV